MTSVDLLAIVHGMLGIFILMGIGGGLASLWHEPKNIRALKIFSVLSTVSAFLIVLVGDLLYIVYRSPNNARSLLVGSPNEWAHEIGFEFKEHAGHFVPVLLLVAAFLVFYYQNDLSRQPRVRKSAIIMLIAALAFTFVELALGALITGVQPVI